MWPRPIPRGSSRTSSTTSSRRTALSQDDYARQIDDALKGLNAILSNARLTASSEAMSTVAAVTTTTSGSDELTNSNRCRDYVASIRVGSYPAKEPSRSTCSSTRSSGALPSVTQNAKKSSLKHSNGVTGVTGSEVLDIINGGFTRALSTEPIVYDKESRNHAYDTYNTPTELRADDNVFDVPILRPIEIAKTPEPDLYRNSLRTIVEHLSSDIQELKAIVIGRQYNARSDVKQTNLLLSKKLQNSLTSLQRMAIQESLSNLRGTVKACVVSPQPVARSARTSPSTNHVAFRYPLSPSITRLGVNESSIDTGQFDTEEEEDERVYPVTLTIAQKNRLRIATTSPQPSIPDYLLPFRLPPPTGPPTTPEYAPFFDPFRMTGSSTATVRNKRYRFNVNSQFGRAFSAEAPCTGCNRRISRGHQRPRSKSCERY